jgi:hypothetical protein
LRQLQLLQAEITTNTSSPVAGWQNDDRPVSVHESSGYRAIIVWLLSSIQAPGGARPMSARAPFKSDAVFSRTKNRPIKKIIARSPPGDRTMSARWYLYSVIPKIIVRPPLAFKYYLKLEGARPMSKIFSCCRPIVTAPDGRRPILRFFGETDAARRHFLICDLGFNG